MSIYEWSKEPKHTCWCCGGRGYTMYKGLQWPCNICDGTGMTNIPMIDQDRLFLSPGHIPRRVKE